jgi:hypothetical protein
MPGVTPTDLDAMFSYHAPSAAQVAQYDALRAQAKALAALILAAVPASAEQTLAVRHVQQAVMFANAGIALHPTG